nr:MFS-type transporter clz9-like [Hydra vulgaris]
MLVCEEKKTIYHAAKECSVPKETNRRRIKQQEFKANKREGRKSVLSDNDETMIVAAAQYCQRYGLPLDSLDINNLVAQFCTAMRMKTLFKNGIPGKDWIISFRKRHVDKLRLHKPEILTFLRAKSVTREVLDNILSDVIHNNNIVQKVTASSGKAVYSVLFCVSADGRYLPPFVVFKGEGYLYSKWIENGPPGCAFGATESGWMQDFLFENGFVEHFIPFVDQDEKPILLLYDGHCSHLIYGTIKAAMDNHIQIVCLPPNCLHALQPLDEAVFGPLKNEWRKILKRESETWIDSELKVSKVFKEHLGLTNIRIVRAHRTGQRDMSKP